MQHTQKVLLIACSGAGVSTFAFSVILDRSRPKVIMVSTFATSVLYELIP
jgi:hypothetical protein